MVLPENVDATYPDRNAGDAAHQQHHDEIHAAVNSRGAANGIATLDAAGLLPEAQVPTRLTATQLSASYVPRSEDRLWLPASMFSLQGGAPTLTGSAGPGAVQGWLLDAATLEHVVTMFRPPVGWATADLDVWWLNQGAGAGDVRWQCQLVEHTVGSAATTTIQDTSATVTAAAQNVISERVGHLAGMAVDPARLYRVTVLRDAANAADTLANDVLFIGAMLRRAS